MRQPHTWADIPSGTGELSTEQFNAMAENVLSWRDEPIPVNVRNWRKAGLTDAEIARLIEYLEAGE